MNEKGNCSTPFAAGLLGGLVGSLFTLTAVYVANQENRKRLSVKFDGLKKALSEKSASSKEKLAGNLKEYADKLET